MKILYLIPPSEWKTPLWDRDLALENLSFPFDTPRDIAVNATQKDLKCMGKRYDQAKALNARIGGWPFLQAVRRYDGVMYDAIDYRNMSDIWKKYFDSNFLILSWFYGLLRPKDNISDYKLPIETRGLLSFWWDTITDALNSLDVDYIVDLLPLSYKKMMNLKKIRHRVVEINFLETKDGKARKIAHGVKKIKGEYIQAICEKGGICLGSYKKSIDIFVR